MFQNEKLAILRDRRAPGGAILPPGDRRAIDACIATHSVLMDLSERVVWVSQGPHLVGQFIPFGFPSAGGFLPFVQAFPKLPTDGRGCP